MTEPAAKPSASKLILPLVLMAAFAGLYWYQASPRKAETASAVDLAAPAVAFSKALATGEMEGVVIKEPRKAVDAFSFKASDGSVTDLSKWKGRVVLLNLWATWCAPCRKEMPSLAELQKQLGGADFEVVALSVDMKGKEASEAFLKTVQADSLAVYTDVEMASMTALDAVGLPATVIIDKSGKEAARRLGPAEWASGDAVKLIRSLMAEKI